MIMNHIYLFLLYFAITNVIMPHDEWNKTAILYKNISLGLKYIFYHAWPASTTSYDSVV